MGSGSSANHLFTFGDEGVIANIRSESPSSSTLSHIHLIRVPKASSTSLSAVARRSVGCEPPGPCCNYPGDPPGTCPSKELFQCNLDKRVIGCTHHYPNPEALYDQSIVTITMVREPFRRALSAYFYPVKMFSGHYAYKDIETCRLKSQCSASLELAVENLSLIDVIGLSEMWELYMLLFSIKLPNLSVNSLEFSMESNHTQRKNNHEDYLTFKEYSLKNLTIDLSHQSRFDVEIYQRVVDIVCNDLHFYNLWNLDVIQRYWRKKSIYNSTNCP
eukprot:gene20070-26059_t